MLVPRGDRFTSLFELGLGFLDLGLFLLGQLHVCRILLLQSLQHCFLMQRNPVQLVALRTEALELRNFLDLGIVIASPGSVLSDKCNRDGTADVRRSSTAHDRAVHSFDVSARLA